MNKRIAVRYLGNCVNARVDIPTSKSISNRVLIIQQMMTQKPNIIGLSQSTDTIALAKILDLTIHKKNATLNAYEGGTTLRFALAYLSQLEGEWSLFGSKHLMNRPLYPLIKALKQLGADIKYVVSDKGATLKIVGKKLKGGRIEIDNRLSSQFVSALMLIAPFVNGGLQIKLSNTSISIPYIDLTIEIMQMFGAVVSRQGSLISIENMPYQRSEDFFVEADWSSAAPWYLYKSLVKCGEIQINDLNFNSLQPDSRLLNIFESLNVNSRQTDKGVCLTSTIEYKSNFDKINLEKCPDSAMAIICALAAKNSAIEICGLTTLNYKESKRLTLLSFFLNEMGFINHCPTEDKLVLEGKNSKETPGQLVVNPQNDHRLAMTFAIMAACGCKIEIMDYECVNKSYPEFWSALSKCGYSIEFC